MPSQDLKIDDFSGGETDNYVNGPTNRGARMRNFLITRNKKPMSRDGSALYDAELDQIPAGNQRISRIKFFQDKLFEMSARNIYYRTTTFDTLTGPVDGNPAFGAGGVSNHVAVAEWQKHMLLTIDEYSTPRKVFYNGSAWCVRNLGLPELASSPTITPDANDSKTYIYYFFYKYSYTVGTVSFIDYGPVTSVSVTSGSNFSGVGHKHSITNIPVLSNGSTECWDTANIKVEIYRTSHAGTVGKYVGEVTNGTTTYTDQTTDDNLTTTIYTNGGRVENEPPPKAKYVAVANDITWYANCKVGNEEFKNRVYQSLAGDPDACPSDFTTDVDEDITGISNVDIYPIVFTAGKCYRLEGSVDSFGRGFVRRRVISDTVGCVSNDGIVRTVKGLYFPAKDGFYYTDGFNIQKLSEHRNDSYALCVDSTAQAAKISGAMDPVTKRVYWTMQEDPSDTETNAIWILDPHWGLTEESCFTSWDAGEDMKPTSLEFINGELARADSRGYVLVHSEDLYTDPVIDTSALDTGDWTTKAVEYDYTSCAFSFGSETVRKYVTKLLSVFKNLTNLSVQPQSINDDAIVVKDLKEARFRSNITWGDDLSWGDESIIWNYNGLIMIDRHFPATGLRCTYKQVRYIPSTTVIARSDDYDTATVDATAKTVLLESGEFPLDLENYQIFFENTDYETGLTISIRTDDTLTVIDPDDNLVDGAGQKWVIKGIRKSERMSLESYTIGYDMYGKSQTGFKAGDGGGNA